MSNEKLKLIRISYPNFRSVTIDLHRSHVIVTEIYVTVLRSYGIIQC